MIKMQKFHRTVLIRDICIVEAGGTGSCLTLSLLRPDRGHCMIQA